MEKSKAQILGEQSFDSMLDPNGSYTQYGLTKREYFAGLAMQAVISNGKYTELETSIVSVNFADALLEELAKSK